MWPVVVLGLITAVLAWVWFGSRGKESSGDTGLGTHLTPLQEEPESEDTQPQKTPHTGSVLSLSPHTTTQLDKELSTTGRDEGYGQGETFLHEDLVQDHKDGGHLTAPHIRQDPPQPSKPKVQQPTGVKEQVHEGLSSSGDTGVKEQVHEGLSSSGDKGVKEQVHEGLSSSGDTGVKEQVHEVLSPTGVKEQVHEGLSPSGDTGVKEQVHEGLSSSGDTGDELVGTREELHLSIGGQATQVTVEDLKSAMVTEEKLVQTSKENSFVFLDKVVPIAAKTGLMPPDHDQDDGWTLVNGSEEQVQTDHETVCLQDNAPTVAISSRQVNRSASANFDQYDHSKLESSDQSELVQSFDKKPLVNLENTACAQVNGQMANNVSTEKCCAEVAIHQKAEDVILTSPTVENFVLFHSSNQEEESPDFKWSGSSENACFATPSEAKLHDDPQRTKRVAAVQPIPQNVSLGFKVHYITDTDSQVIAVIGDHEKLGEWESFVPLSSDKDGNWSHSLALPADANVEWKFVMVENGKIKRWEECYNRHLRTAHEDLATQQWWGFP